jgi:hypothetical protein
MAVKRNPIFDAACKAHGLPLPEMEFKFALPRKWAFDYLFSVETNYPKIGRAVAMEVQGGLFPKKGQLLAGRHTRGKALLDEYEKLNEAQILGYKVLLVTWNQINSGEAFALVKRALES